MSEMNPEIVLEARGIVKRYPGNLALDHAAFLVRRNQVNVLIGENGAGKSTLMRILAGVETADEGSILLDGAPIAIRSPREAADCGIAIVHQELSIFPNLDISENIFAGRELTRAASMLDRVNEDSRSASALERLRKPMAVTTQAAQLSLGCRQMVEIARALVHGAKILILDEPTSALSMTETESLYEVITSLKRSGTTIVYISHRLHELLHLGDCFTVLRSGRTVGEAPRADVTRQWIVERMSGKPKGGDSNGGEVLRGGAPVLRVSGLELAGSSEGEALQAPLHDLNFTLREGEVLGVYGLLGAGRTEMVEALAGSRPILSGEISLRGQILNLRSVHSAMKAGIVLSPEDRQRNGLFPELSIRENIALTGTGGPFLFRGQETVRVRELAKGLNIDAGELEMPVARLSGGNQQKVLLARCLMRSPSVLLLDEPTRGIDAGAKVELYRTLRLLAAKGLSILFTSSEIEETRVLADRVLVLCQGRVSAEFTREEFSDEALFAAASPRADSFRNLVPARRLALEPFA